MAGSDGWKERAKSRKLQQENEIPEEWRIQTPSLSIENLNVLDVPKNCGLLTPREIFITETDDIEFTLRKLGSGEWSSFEVTTAYYKRAIIAHQLTNCLTEIFIERALSQAKEMDNYLAKTGKTKGPLHGLPISVKDQFSMKGLETIMGYVSWIGTYSEHDAVLIEILYDCGAIPFVRTNVPQTLNWGETFNHVFGRTTNPYNTSLTPGGSSGGEGALLALKGSPLGVGTDIGGSVRIPSSFCGLYGLRPSYDRFPYSGALNIQDGQASVPSVLGPMSTSLNCLRVFTKAILNSTPWDRDPLVVRKPWDERAYALEDHGGRGGHLCFAILWDNGIIKPSPPVARALEMTKSALERAGHKVIDWEPHRLLEIYENVESIFGSDGFEDVKRECAKSGEPLLTNMRLENETRFPPIPPYVWTLVGEPKMRNTDELWQLVRKKKELRKSHLDHWQSTKDRTGTGRPVDGIISPVAAIPACPHGINTDYFYTTLANSMDYTSASFPVTTVNPDLDIPVSREEFYNEEDKALHSVYKPELFINAPVGLQLMGKSLEEEAIIAMTEIIDAALKSYSTYNST